MDVCKRSRWQCIVKLLFNLQSMAGARSGIGIYTHHLIAALLDNPEVYDLSGFIGRSVLQGDALRRVLLEGGVVPPIATQSVSNARLKESIKWLARSIPGAYPIRSAVRDWQGARILKPFASTDFIYHEPNYIPVSYSGKMVVTVHDLSHIRFPEFHPAERVAFMNRRLKTAVDRADFIVADSAFVKDEILDVFPVSGEKIIVTHLGVDEAFHPRSEIETLDTLHQFNLSYRSFVLSVGTLEPRKNLERFLNAYGALPEGVRRDYPLVLAGGGGWKDSDLKRQIQQMERRGEVIRTGYLPRSQLLDLYASAAVFAYPSIYEGFGLPVLEGFASGTPVLTSNVTSMPEVSRGAGLEVNPLSVDEIRHGLFSLLDDSSLRSRHAQLGLERVQAFTWAKCAEQTMAVYKQLG